MTDPTDRERVAKALYSAAGAGARIPWEELSIGGDTMCRWLHAADAAIALGAKPPVDPVDELIAEMRIWLNRHAIFRNRNGEWLPGGCMAGDIVRHVLARAKPPVDPFQTLMGEVMEVWARNCTIQHVTTQDVTAMEMVVRHVITRAKEMGL